MESVLSKILLFFALVFSTVCVAEDNVESSSFVKDMVERINKRYDDFFRYHRDMEERLAKLEGGRGERKKAESAYYAKIEEARVAYVKNKKPKNSDEALRVRWEQEEKERKEKFELFRRRHVQARDEIERYRLKGRKIPELKEYDLEGY